MRQCLVCGSGFEPASFRGRPPETCSPACLKKRKAQQRRETKERAVARGCPPELHGTQSGATHYSCHCDKCRKWWRDYQRARRAAQKVAEAVTP